MSAALTESLLITVAGVGLEVCCAVAGLWLCGAVDLAARGAAQLRRAVVMARLRMRRAAVRAVRVRRLA